MTEPQEHHCSINLDNITGLFARQVQVTIERAAFGLQHTATSLNGPLHLPTFLCFAAADEGQRSIEAVANDYRCWVLANGFRDCIEVVHRLLEEVRLVCAVAHNSRNGRLEAEAWNKEVTEEVGKFHGAGLPKKMDALGLKYNLIIPSDESDRILSLNKARNCLVHRNGVVGNRDVDDDQQLVCHWRKWEVLVDGADGKRPCGRNAIVQAGEKLLLRTGSPVSKTFAIGDPVVFTVEEFSEVCYTFVRFSQIITQQAKQYVLDRGIPVRQPNE